jgi:hypothetical protein
VESARIAVFRVRCVDDEFLTESPATPPPADSAPIR